MFEIAKSIRLLATYMLIGLLYHGCSMKARGAELGDDSAQTFLAFELTDDENGGEHFGSGLNYRRFVTRNFGLGAEVISYAMADEAIDAWSLEVAWRQPELLDSSLTGVVTSGVGRNEEDANVLGYVGAELHWWHLFVGARAILEQEEGAKGLFKIGAVVNW